MTTPPANTCGRLAIPPTVAAASARTISDGPRAMRVTIGSVGPTRTADTPASRPANVHTASEMRRTGMPARLAASLFSAAARLASPTRVERKNRVSATVTIGTTRRMSSSPVVRRSDPMWKLAWNGVGNVARPSRPRLGMNALSVKKSCDAPMVATMRMRRDPLPNFRITTSSVSAPAAAATNSDTSSAGQ